jgi:type II secretory pathway component PulF
MICTVAFGVVIFFLLFLLPRVEGILNSLGGDMPLIARILIGSSDMALKGGPFAALATAIVAVAFSRWRKTPLGRARTDYWLLRIPFIGKIFLYSEIFQSSSLMGTLMESGINTTETLRLAERTLKNTQLKAKFAVCRRQIQEGLSLAAAFKMTHFMPDIAIDILTVGENTGNLVNSLREITKMNRRDLTRSLQILTGAVSTGALVFAFVLVTLIALTIIFSVFGISSTLAV